MGGTNIKNITERDIRLLPFTRAILNDVAVNGGGKPITYGQFAERATRLSGEPVSPLFHAGRMLGTYAYFQRQIEQPDLCHLVVRQSDGKVGKGYKNRGQRAA
jgi:hypothetical protein